MLTIGCFAASLFAGAFLLFSVQPVVTRLVLPRLGGSPAVWNTCVCFFQAALLLGYGYAHLSVARLRLRAQWALHAAVLAAGAVVLPLSLGAAAPAGDAYPVLWLLALLTWTVAPPFIAVSATAPLLQSWFARTRHPQSGDPYFLYAASNAGSLVALLSYPVLIETTMPLGVQTAWWSYGYGAAAAGILLCGGMALRDHVAPAAGPSAADGEVAVTPAERLRWLALAAVPSGLMLAVTTHITTDIATAPLLWVLPLAIYILTVVIAFGRRQRVGVRRLRQVQAIALVGAACAALNGGVPSLPLLIVPLLAFAATALACHVELAQRRPGNRHLTGYFMLISLGGAIGGWFCGLLAPVLFTMPAEYPILLVAACLLRPPPAPGTTPRRDDWAKRGDILLPILVPVAFLAIRLPSALWSGFPASLHTAVIAAAWLVPAAMLLWMARRRLRFALAVAGCFAVPLVLATPLASARSFFGVFRVGANQASEVTVLSNGTTVHGVASTRPGEAALPLSYYHPEGAFGRLFAALRRRGQTLTSVGVIGLGAGTLACYARPGESWDIREIDPLVERLARDERWFHFLSQCGSGARIILGDGRVTLANDVAAKYDLLIVDAFSSDSVPIHLMTRQALALYLARLKPGGIVVFHVSNRFLALSGVAARLAADAGLPARRLETPFGADILRQPMTEVVAIAAPGGNLDVLDADGWSVPTPGASLWTDDRADLVRVMRW